MQHWIGDGHAGASWQADVPEDRGPSSRRRARRLLDLQGQDAEIEEAARLDGARWSQIFWNVSLPLMMPVLAVALVLRAIDIVTMFASVFIITGGTPGGTTETISYFIYRIGFKTFNFGYASAVSVVMLALTTWSRSCSSSASSGRAGLDHGKRAREDPGLAAATAAPPAAATVPVRPGSGPAKVSSCATPSSAPGRCFAWRRSCGSCRSG